MHGSNIIDCQFNRFIKLILNHVRNSDPDDWRDSYIVVTAVAVMVLDDVSGRSGSCVLRIEGHCLRER